MARARRSETEPSRAARLLVPLVAGGALLAALLGTLSMFLGGAAGPRSHGGVGMHEGMVGAHGPWSGWLAVAALAILVAAAVVVVWAVTGRSGYDGERDRALAELRAAYARGELDDEEFEARKRRLHEE